MKLNSQRARSLAPLQVLILVIAMLLAGLACGSETPDDSFPTDSPAFSTATPGGSISIWLLTTTPTLEGQPVLVTTPLDTILTATAAVQFADAGTATALAPTVTPEVLIAPAECPPLSAVTLQPFAPLYSRYPQVILQFLAAGGATSLLQLGLRDWGAINSNGGIVNADRDMNGDGAPEIVVIALDPANANKSPQPGDMWVFSCQSKTYRLIYDAGYSTTRSPPTLISSEDVTGDGFGDLLYTTQECTSGTCLTTLAVVGWNSVSKTLTSLTSQAITLYQPSVVISNTGGTAKDIQITASINPDPAAGPQRAITSIWRWNGTQFTPAEAIKSPPQYRIQVIHDGDDLLAAGNGEGAMAQYLLAADSAGLLEWGLPNELMILTTFARYRLMLAYTLANRIDQAQLAHDQLMAMFAQSMPVPGLPTPIPVVGPQPGIENANMADLFWQNFAVNRDMARACQVVVAYAQATPGALATLNSFGYANRPYSAGDVCPLK